MGLQLFLHESALGATIFFLASVAVFRAVVLRHGPFRKYPTDAQVSFGFSVARGIAKLSAKTINASQKQSAIDAIKAWGSANPMAIKNLKFDRFGEAYDDNSFWLHYAGPTKPVLIHFHGGAYFAQLSSFHVNAVVGMYQAIPASKRDFSLLELDYKLAGSGARWPTQRDQLHATYHRLLADGFDRIFFLGDSAGGNLALTYLQFLRRHEPTTPVPEKLILVSPWVKLQQLDDEPPVKAYTQNAYRDSLSKDFIRNDRLQEALLGRINLRRMDVSPGNCPYHEDDWKELPRDVYVMAGEDEIMRDDILQWAYYALGCPFWKRSWGEGNGKFDASYEYVTRANGGLRQVVVDPWGMHDEFATIEGTRYVQGTPVDPVQFFGMARIANFLYETL
ncbi:hypothetical protein DICA3_E13982 [Diutina catenulata]